MLYTWGSNKKHRLGYIVDKDQDTPATVMCSQAMKAVAVAATFSVAISSCVSHYFQLVGFRSTLFVLFSLFFKKSCLIRFEPTSSKLTLSFLIIADGELFHWGEIATGTGVGNFFSRTKIITPTKIAAETIKGVVFTQIACGKEHAIALSCT